MVELNVAGWTAVLAPGAVAGFVAGLAVGRYWALAVPLGVVCSWIAALSVDRWRWSRSDCGYDITDHDPASLAMITAQVDREGIPFRVSETMYEPNDPVRQLTVQMRHRARADAAVHEVRRR